MMECPYLFDMKGKFKVNLTLFPKFAMVMITRLIVQ